MYYRHLKTGNYYKVLEEGMHTETGVQHVVYKSIFDGRVWIRPATMFYDGRFTKVTTQEAMEQTHGQVQGTQKSDHT